LLSAKKSLHKSVILSAAKNLFSSVRVLLRNKQPLSHLLSQMPAPLAQGSQGCACNDIVGQQTT
jgi:hypothetical protein